MTSAAEVALKVALVEMVRVLAALSARVQNGPETATLAAKIAAFIAADEAVRCAGDCNEGYGPTCSDPRCPERLDVPPGPDDLREAGA